MPPIKLKIMIYITALLIIGASADTKVCNLEAAGWEHARFCPAGTTWFQSADQLLGTDSYGFLGSTTA